MCVFCQLQKLWPRDRLGIIGHDQMRVRVDCVILQVIDMLNIFDVVLYGVVVHLVHICLRNRPECVVLGYGDALIITIGFLCRIAFCIGTERADCDGGGDDQTECHHK